MRAPLRVVRDGLQFAEAYLILTIVSLFLRLFGFKFIHQFALLSFRKGNILYSLANPGLLDRIVEKINQASQWHLQGMGCLQRSFTAFLMLRWRGIPVNLCIGVSKFRFRAHAWLEYRGLVVNDDPKVSQSYSQLLVL